MFGVKDNFPTGGPVNQVPTSWFNKVAKFLNHIIPGYGIKITLPDEPSIDQSVLFEVDTDVLDERYQGGGVTTTVTPLADAATAVIGNSQEAATANHRHPISTPSAASSNTTIGTAGSEGSTSADASTYTTPGGANGKGLTLNICSRVQFSGTYLYGFSRQLKFDQFGRLVSVSAETRYNIDTPVTYNP